MTMSRGVQRTQIVCTFVLPSKTQLSDMRILLWRKTNPVKSSRICCSCIGWLLAEGLCAFMLSFPGGYVHFVNYSFWSITGFFQKKKMIVLCNGNHSRILVPPSGIQPSIPYVYSMMFLVQYWEQLRGKHWSCMNE